MAGYKQADAMVSARRAATVTPNDSTVLECTRFLWVGGVGNVAVTLVDGGTVTFTAVAAGTRLDVQAVKVMATNTSATLILALY